jgi:TetR/AcrR family transcriptional repressor of nem operon
MSRGSEKQFDPDIALAKAMEVFWARGYEAASLSKLLELMGIGKKSLYDTFGNKRSLFLKALDHYTLTVVKFYHFTDEEYR